MVKKDYAVYWAAFKILLEKDGKFLFLKTVKAGLLDLPGGRADYDEYQIPLKKILEREVREELGAKIKYSLGNIIFQYRRYAPERKMYNLITVYEAKYLSGSIKLSFEHSKYKWLDVGKYKFKEEEFYTKEEYKAFKKYFRNIQDKRNIIEKEVFDEELAICEKLAKKNKEECAWGKCKDCGVIPFLYKLHKGKLLEKPAEIKKTKSKIIKIQA